MINILVITIIFFGMYMLIRSECVYNYRIKILRQYGIEEYDRLPDYNTMICRFWDWNFEGMRK